MEVGINLEFARSARGMSLEESIRQAEEIGYKFVEPYVYSEVNLSINSHLGVRGYSNYCHMNVDNVDPESIRTFMASVGMKFSAFDAHAPLLLPQISVPYLRKGIDFAVETGCSIVITDEGPVPEWMALEEAFDVMCITLEYVLRYAQDRGIIVAIEPHNALTINHQKISQLMERFSSKELSINFDTGNTFLAGNDPVQMLHDFAERVVHVHAKDIPRSQLSERGEVTGTRVGVALGDGVIDFSSIVRVLESAQFKGVVSVECDTLAQAKKSFSYLESLLEKQLRETKNV